ncbi:hypothetical protein EMIHUDRAFT_101584 [Emiliania huxleyi CCMP1516]|uniref:Dihydroorotase n=2 Tax=Emiliania huxleyi TaxID=2903 RepID=A0A0D3JE21_EMIH1|nr:hypothetical protein EMIHUDRAFT_101584 [Emiliania huxleyi CCMP1516]EOD21756.1 hypothetical protein EMIHUDRAFT_101584 [Emiliania huxleyi CCMP1516]|eukprot:XP_005774185.1 hypothetical protein EMIHUDRAFT_101584 [Emiliania huxleyi CCMP1516]
MCDRVPEPFNSRRELRMRRPDDWHHHLRDGPDVLRDTVRAAARAFSRAIIMPNLVPPVTTVAAAGEYRERIEAALAASGGAPGSFTPLMTLYLTDTTTVAAVEAAAASGFIKAFKLYPAGATTNSDSGVTDYAKIEPALRARLAEIARDHARLRAMAAHGLVLCVHGEARRQSPRLPLFSPLPPSALAYCCLSFLAGCWLLAASPPLLGRPSRRLAWPPTPPVCRETAAHVPTSPCPHVRRRPTLRTALALALWPAATGARR